MVVQLLFAACCAICLPVTLQQVVPAPLSLSGLCHLSQEDLRVLPSSGFTRAVLAPFTSTTTISAGAPAPVPSAASLAGCLFQSFDPAFDELIGDNQTVYQVGPRRDVAWAAESPAYLSETDEIIFASYLTQSISNVSRVDLNTGEVTVVDIDPPIGNAGGATSYFGQVAFGAAGQAYDDADPPGIFIVDPYEGNSTIVANNFFGIRYNGFVDVQALSDGSIIAPDANFTSSSPPQPPFKNPAVLPNDVWIFPPTGPPRVLIDSLPNCPDGLATSPDEKTLYLSVDPLTPEDPFATALVDVIYAFDLVNVSGGIFATGKRVFAKADYSSFDGIVVDKLGNVYATMGDGVAIYNPAGTLLGKIALTATLPIGFHPTNSVGLAGNRLIMMHNSDIFMLPLNASVIPGPVGQ